MLFVDYEIEGEAETQRAFASLQERLRNLRPLWPKLAEQFYEIERQQFNSEGSRANSWAPLAASTLAGKAINYPGQPILRATNALFESLTSKDDENAIYGEEDQSLMLGTRLDYAVYHQQGTERMPARPPIDLLDRDLKSFADVAVKEFADLGLALGFEVTYG